MEEIAAKSTGQSKHDAAAYLKRMSEFPYIMSAVLTQYILAYIRPLSVALQSKTCDLVYAHTECQSLIALMRSQHNEETFRKLYDRATHILRETFGEDQVPDMPRSNPRKRQMHRANAPSSNPEEYYRMNYYYPFLDHVVSHLEMRFPPELKSAMLGYYLLPSKLNKLTDHAEQSILEQFKSDLPMPDSFGAEVKRWKESHHTRSPEKSVVELINATERDFFPNIYVILSLLITLPVGSCSCERSFSALRRLKTWCRASMGEERLNGVALANIHKHHPLLQELDTLRVLKAWDASLHRRVALAFTHTA
jgi:hypothetical protein